MVSREQNKLANHSGCASISRSSASSPHPSPTFNITSGPHCSYPFIRSWRRVSSASLIKLLPPVCRQRYSNHPAFSIMTGCHNQPVAIAAGADFARAPHKRSPVVGAGVHPQLHTAASSNAISPSPACLPSQSVSTRRTLILYCRHGHPYVLREPQWARFTVFLQLFELPQPKRRTPCRSQHDQYCANSGDSAIRQPKRGC